MSNEYIIEITPVAKPRMTQRDVWAKRKVVVDYHAFADQLRLEAKKKKLILPDYFDVAFYLPMPESWSQRKRREMSGKPHQVKKRNDRDNLLKSLQDVLRPEDDGLIWGGKVDKYWGETGAIVINF